MQNKKLVICETFYSIQGEGKSIGTPVVFLRLAGCNLNCRSHDDKNNFLCDSKKLWTNGRAKNFIDIISYWQENNYLEHLKNGAHLVITGGEPLIQQHTLINFITYFISQNNFKPFIEVETNATILPSKDFYNSIDQFNVSPKLSNSGNSLNLRYHINSLKFFSASEKSFFKFVISAKFDIEEIFSNYIKPLQISKNKIYLMPAGQTQQELNKTNFLVIELCKKYKFNFSARLHIMLWDNRSGI